MAIYRCEVCDRYIDADYDTPHSIEELPDSELNKKLPAFALICEACFEELSEEE